MADFDTRLMESRGPTLPEHNTLRVKTSAYSGFGIYAPLEQRIRQLMHNIASNQEMYGIDSSVIKLEKGEKSNNAQSE